MQMKNTKYYEIALSMIDGIGPALMRQLVYKVAQMKDLFIASQNELQKQYQLSPKIANAIVQFKDFDLVDKELEFMRKYDVQCITITDENYPKRLLNCFDPPFILYKKGNVNLENPRIVSVVGTRNCTAYGKKMTEEICNGLQKYNVIVISGLAYGVDALAHNTCNQLSMPNIAVLGSGLSVIYPSEHRNLANDILESDGALLSEFTHLTSPERYNFPRRNRIVAGLADATIVVETKRKGGSMITAQLANDYNREVYALPGRLTDSSSEGCNYLIKNNLAIPFESIDSMALEMGWTSAAESSINRKRNKASYSQLSEEEVALVEILQHKERFFIDELLLASNLPNGKLAGILLNLELSGVIQTLPGNFYALL